MKSLTILLFFLSAFKLMNAQLSAGTAPFIEVHHLKDSMMVKENSFAFNNISLLNKSGKSINARIIFTAPEFIDIISSPVQDVILQPGINQVIPLRFTIASSQVPVDWYPVEAEIRFKETGHLIRTVFYISPIESLQFSASLQQPAISIPETDKEIPVGIYLANTGNQQSSYQITVQPGNQLKFAPISYTLELVPGESRVLTPRILLSPKDLLYFQKDELLIFIKSTNGEQKMLVQQVFRAGNRYRGNAENYTKMPVTLGVNFQNFAGRMPFVSFNAQGSLKLKNEAQLSFLLQTDNYYKNFTANSHLATVRYSKGPWQFTAGSIVDFNHFLIDGMGAELQYANEKKQIYNLMAVKSRTGDTRQLNFKTSQPLNKSMTVSTNVFLNQDVNAKQTAALAINKLDWQLKKHTRFSAEAGGAIEKTNRAKLDTTLYGAHAGYQLEQSGQHYLLNSTITWYNKNFPGFNRGFLYQLHEARYLWKDFFAGPFYETNKRNYVNTKDSLLNFIFNNNNRETGLRLGYYDQKLSAMLSASSFLQKQDSSNAPEAYMNKLSMNLIWKISNKWNISAISTLGSIRVNNLINSTNRISTFTNFISVQSNRYGLQLRFDKGPFYYYEIKQYLNNPVQWERLQIAPYIEIPWQRKNLYFRFQANYLHESQNNNHYLLAYTNIQYALPSAGLDMSLTAQANVSGKENPMVSLSVRKSLQVPVGKNKSIRNCKLRCFYDKNGNGIEDEGEEPVKDIKLKLNNLPLITDASGEISITNSTEEKFLLDCSEANPQPGWIPQQGFRQQLKISTDIHYISIPYIRSKMLTGKLVFVRDPNSNVSIQAGGIRLTALSSKGEEFHTLTNDEGEFYFNLPADIYIVSVNTSVFGNQYKVIEPRKNANLENNETLNLVFEIRQNKRQINIRKEE